MTRSRGVTKVAVLGGGAGGLSTALALTATPELRRQFQVEVYQRGWRLGGKAASGYKRFGTNNSSAHAEDNGLQYWFGCYQDTLRLLQSVYEELGRSSGRSRLAFEDVVRPLEHLVLWDRDGDRQRQWSLALPAGGSAARGSPASSRPLEDALRWLVRVWETAQVSIETQSALPIPAQFREALSLTPERIRDAFHWLVHLWPGLGPTLGVHGVGVPPRLRQALALVASESGSGLRKLPEVARLLRLAARDQRDAETRALWPFVSWPDSTPFQLRCLNRILDLFAAIATGLVEDSVLQAPLAFDPNAVARLNQVDFRQWLAPRVQFADTPDFSFVRVLYDRGFAYEDGERSRPNLAAGIALESLFQIVFRHEGVMIFRLAAPVGDAMFAPIYQLLKRRGVRFRFFHCVTDLRLSADRTVIDSVDVVSQVALCATRYDPLVKHRNLYRWPWEPKWRLLENGAALREKFVNFEHEVDPLNRGPIRLQRGLDFDAVVLGLPVAALAQIASELAHAHPRFAAMVAHSHEVATSHAQLWLSRDADELGLTPQSRVMAAGMDGDFDTAADMTDIADYESHPGSSHLQQIVYLRGVLATPANSPVSGSALVREAADRLVRERLSAVESPVLTADEQPGASGGAYYETNSATTTPAGSPCHRLGPTESGFGNLVLAGDWTKTDVNGGFMEAAVSSGSQAAAAITMLDHHADRAGGPAARFANVVVRDETGRRAATVPLGGVVIDRRRYRPPSLGQ